MSLLSLILISCVFIDLTFLIDKIILMSLQTMQLLIVFLIADSVFLLRDQEVLVIKFFVLFS